MTAKTPTILIVIGITGDLATHKLLPAIEAIAEAKALPGDLRILGVTRQPAVSINDVCANVGHSSFVREHLQFFRMDVDNPSEYGRLADCISEIEHTSGAAQRLFYLAVPPRAARSIIEHLGNSGLAAAPQTKLLLEKPFGIDLASATDLVQHINRHFAPEQVYRIDHYLAKEMAQNLIVFRECNSLFRRTWNNQFIERIEILAAEEAGIDGRVDFYEQTGALRDIVQSHLLQLAALTLMRPVTQDEMRKVPLRRLEALQNLSLSGDVRRGQYEGYRGEVRNPESTVETYVSMTLTSRDPHFAGVPVMLSAGKKLGKKCTEIRIFYKKDRDMEANELVLRLQPDEGVALSLWSKRPGYEKDIEMKTLDFAYADHYGALPEAYEKVLVDVMRSNHDLSVSSEEVLESWRIIAPVQEAWAKSADDLYIYKNGTAL